MKINLIPEVKQEQLRIHKLNATVTTVATFAAFIVGGIIICLALYNIFRTTQIASTNKKIDNVNKELEAYADLEQTVISLETGLTEIKQILTGGPQWSKFFNEFEKATPNDIQFTNFQISGNEITVTAKGKNVGSVDRFIKSFSNYKVDDKNLFSSVYVSGYSAENNQVLFQAKFTLNGGILW